MNNQQLSSLRRLVAVLLIADGSARLVSGRGLGTSRPLPGRVAGSFQRLIGAAEVFAGLRSLRPVGVVSLYRPLAPVFDHYTYYNRDVLQPQLFAAFDQALRERLPGGGRILDLGCGTGPNLARLLNLGLPFLAYTGVDLSADMLRQARAKFGHLRDVEFRQLDLLADPLPEGPFDLVISTNVFEHLPDAKGVAERAVARLRPGGSALFIFLVDAGLGQTVAMQFLFHLFNARFLNESEYRQFPELAGEQRFTGRNRAVNVLLELRRPAADRTAV